LTHDRVLPGFIALQFFLAFIHWAWWPSGLSAHITGRPTAPW